MSLIWGIDTLSKWAAGLDIQQVLLTNAAFTLGSMVFEVPRESWRIRSDGGVAAALPRHGCS